MKCFKCIKCQNCWIYLNCYYCLHCLKCMHCLNLFYFLNNRELSTFLFCSKYHFLGNSLFFGFLYRFAGSFVRWLQSATTKKLELKFLVACLSHQSAPNVPSKKKLGGLHLPHKKITTSFKLFWWHIETTTGGSHLPNCVPKFTKKN